MRAATTPMRTLGTYLVAGLFAVLCGSALVAAEAPRPDLREGLVGHWKLEGDWKDSSGHGHDGMGRNVDFAVGPHGEPRGAALFNGRDSVIEVADAVPLDLGTGDFSLSVWVKPEVPMRGIFGDIASKFDARRRRGFNFHIAGSSSAYNSMCDARHVHFGIDDGYLGRWEDCGKPCDSNSLITCLVVFEGQLYCGIADAGDPRDAARVFRWAGGTRWIDCGRLGNDPGHLSVQSMHVHEGKLYAGTGIWDWVRARGEEPGKPPAAKPRAFVYEGGTTWRDLGQVGEASRVLCMASFRGDLYVGLDRGPSPGKGRCFKYAGSAWVDCGVPDGSNVEGLLPLGGTLYGATHGSIFRYEGGEKWVCIGDHPFGITQIHSLDVHRGRLHAGTWPQGYVLRHEGGERWSIAGRLGLPAGGRECNEVNDLVIHNGKLYAGVIPKAEAYRYEADGEWTPLGSLAHRPDWARDEWPTWCRLTAMASHGGRLFAGTGSCQGRACDVDPDATLGRVYAIQVGQVVSHERDIDGGWTHLAVVRRGAELKLYVNGRLSTCSAAPEGRILDLSNTEPLLIGFGAQTYFTGALADLRLYARALEAEDVTRILANQAVAEEAVPRETQDAMLELLLPAPQEMEAGTGRLSFGPSIRLSVPEKWAGTIGRHLWLLDEVLRARKAGPVAVTQEASAAAIRVVEAAEGRLPEDGYEMKIGAGAIEIAAPDPGGVFNGLATLSKLIELCGSETIEVPCARIRDWPELATRAVHFDMTCQQYKATYVQQLMRTLARYKVNAILMEYSDMFPFREHKPISRPEAFSEVEIQAIRRTAEECRQEIIPFLQCAGHLEYVLTRPEYSHLSEGHGGYCYCLANEAAVPFAESLIDEIAAQHPGLKRLHIGGDEVGPGTCQRCAAAGDFHARYLKHYARIAEHCLKRGLVPLLWTDVIAPFRLQRDPEAIATRAREAAQVLPHEVIGVDWS